MLSHYSSMTSTSSRQGPHVPAVNGHTAARNGILHRLREVRQREEVSLRTVARRLRLSLPEVRRQEEDPDPTLSTLQAWAEALEVPMSELVGEPAQAVAEKLLWRAKFLQFMKIVRTIEVWSKHKRIQSLAAFLAEQMLSLMPELRDVGPLPTVGKIRDPRISRIEERIVRPESIATTMEEPYFPV